MTPNNFLTKFGLPSVGTPLESLLNLNVVWIEPVLSTVSPANLPFTTVDSATDLDVVLSAKLSTFILNEL